MANDAQIVSCEGDRGTHRPRGTVPVEREGRGACFDRHPHEAARVTPWSRVLPRVRVVAGRGVDPKDDEHVIGRRGDEVAEGLLGPPRLVLRDDDGIGPEIYTR